jgi:hypothetical protein
MLPEASAIVLEASAIVPGALAYRLPGFKCLILKLYLPDSCPFLLLSPGFNYHVVKRLLVSLLS